ncbi:MAG: hypothetical protein U0324_41390 [Polyangiales bacterium]
MTQDNPRPSLSPSQSSWMGGAVFVTGAALFGAALAITSAPSGQSMLRRSERALSYAIQYVPRAAGMASGFAAPPKSHAPAAVAPAATAPARRQRSVWDRPIGEVWAGHNAWSPAVEQEYGRFVTAIGRGFASRRCYRLDDCLLNPAVNPLHAAGDVRLGLHPDCADLAYTLRAYFAFKRDLPFGWVRAMGGDGGDPRYLMYGTPVAWSQWTRFATPREVFTELPNHVHSGMFRLSAKVEEGDTYAVRIDRAAVRPGSNFYDTDGHVLVVYDVDAAGDVYLVDGHPDGSITHKRMNQTYIAGTARWGGGFRNWRPQYVDNGVVLRARNADLADHDPRMQYDRANYVVNGVAVRYDEWVRSRLASR